MIKKLFLLLFLLLVLLSNFCFSFGQSTYETHKEKQFRMWIGINQIKEENLHSKVHTGLDYGLSYGFIKKKKNISSFEVLFFYSKLKTVFEMPASSINLQFNLNYNYQFLTKQTAKSSFYSGIGMAANYSISHFPNWDESHLYWANASDLRFSTRWYYKFSKEKLFIVHLQTPLLFLLSRPELDRQYKIDDLSFIGLLTNFHSSAQIGSWNRNFLINTCFEYRPQNNRKIKISFVYHFKYTKLLNKESNPFFALQNHLGINLYL